MNKPLAATELKALEAQFPVTEPKLTRRQKLNRLAMLVERWTGHIPLYHRLEYASDIQLAAQTAHSSTALGLAAQDDVFQKDGLKGGSLLDVRNYLELTTEELHEFSCDCGGAINRENMAARIRTLAGN